MCMCVFGGGQLPIVCQRTAGQGEEWPLRTAAVADMSFSSAEGPLKGMRMTASSPSQTGTRSAQRMVIVVTMGVCFIV